MFGYLCYWIVLIQTDNLKGPNFQKIQSKSGYKSSFHFADLFFHRSDFGLDQSKYKPGESLHQSSSSLDKAAGNWCPC